MDHGDKTSAALRSMKLRNEPILESEGMRRQREIGWDDKHHYQRGYHCRTPFLWWETMNGTEEGRHGSLNILCDCCKVMPAGARSMGSKRYKLCQSCHWGLTDKNADLPTDKVPPMRSIHIKPCGDCNSEFETGKLKGGLCDRCHFEKFANTCFKCNHKAYDLQHLKLDDRRHHLCEKCISSIISK